MKAIVIAVGDELVSGRTVDTNSAHISAALSGIGVEAGMFRVVADDVDLICREIQEASAEAGAVVVTGGLGPTLDDVTREAMARAAGCELVESPDALVEIQRFFELRGREMSALNARQALKPESAELLVNEWGTAPGLRMRLKEADVFALPGVPREMREMVAAYVLPALAGAGGTVIGKREITVFGPGESSVGARLGEIMERGMNPTVNTTVSGGVITVRIYARGRNTGDTERLIEDTAQQVQARLGPAVVSRTGEGLQKTVVSLLLEKRTSVATAESCTGGLLAGMLTDVPGASGCFEGGWVCYSNRLKQELLDVPESVLSEHGAVSREAVMEMAGRAAELSCAEYGLAVSGIAGPDGGSEEKPVGTVWIALAGGGEPVAERRLFHGGRRMVRERAARTGLNMLRLRLMGVSGRQWEAAWR